MSSMPKGFMADHVQKMIHRNETVGKKINANKPKAMMQQDMNMRRVNVFIDNIVEKLRSIQVAAIDGVQIATTDRLGSLEQLTPACADRGQRLLAWQNLLNSGGDLGSNFTVELDAIFDEITAAEQAITLLSNFDLVISPMLANFSAALQAEKAYYIRVGPWHPSEAQLCLNQKLETSATSTTLTFTVEAPKPKLDSPQIRMVSLHQLLTATMEKLDPAAANQTSVNANAIIRGTITPVGDTKAAVSFNLDPISLGGIDGSYTVNVTMYDCSINSAPMKIHVCSIANTDQVFGDKQPQVAVGIPSVSNGDDVPTVKNAGGVSERNQPVQNITQRSFESVDGQTIGVGRGKPVRYGGIGVGRGVGLWIRPSPVIGNNGELPPMAAAPAPAPVENSAQREWEPPTTTPAIPILEEPAPETHLNSTQPKSAVSFAEELTSLVSRIEEIRMPQTVSTTETVVVARSLPKVDQAPPDAMEETYNTASAAPVMKKASFDDAAMDNPTENSLCKVSKMEDVGGAGRGRSIGQSNGVRPNLNELGILSKKCIAGRMVMRFGMEGKQEPSETCFSFPIGCVKNEITGDYIICDTGHHMVKIFDSQANLKHTIKPYHFKRPAALVVLENNTFAVRDDRRIQVFNMNGELVTRMDDNDASRGFGLATDNQGNLVTLDANMGYSGNAKIVVIDPNTCTVISKSNFVSHHGKQDSKLRFIDCYDDKLYVADLGASRIYCASLTGEPLLDFGHDVFKEPSGITVDAAGIVVCGDSKHDRILAFSKEGELFKHFKFDRPIKRPSGVRLTKDGKLMVMNYLNHYVALFELFPMD